jgi:photosystem II stability/assembly factor-like uncharacterized protein
MSSSRVVRHTLGAFVALALLASPSLLHPTDVAAQDADDPNAIVNPATFDHLRFRMVGPYRGGRSSAVTGVPGEPNHYYMGTTGGGIWETVDAGTNWHPVSDDYFGGSIGAIDVADSDPNVIFAGGGSADIRGNTSTGRGVWKSTDAGKTWRFVGLPEAGQIGRIEIHPSNPDLVYLAALGHPFGKNPERGVYRTEDGGDTWEPVLQLNDSTGAVDLAMNPRNPREIYAGMWRGERKPWTMISGGEEGGVYKTTDGGDTWEKLGGGLPEGLVGKVGVTVSAANPDRVWAIIEAEPAGGVYRSDDAGKTWTRTNSDNNLRQRAWYYTHVQADPNDEHTVWALNTGLYVSVDGGTTFRGVAVPHGDVHDLWINPDDSDYMIVANDGGGQVTVTGGDSWSTYYNQPTAELYDVIVDNGFPYRLYGSQQDNTGISVPAWTSPNSLYPKQNWLYPSSCETGPVALHPDHPDILYGGCYGGAINRLDLKTDQRRNVIAYPQLQLGQAAKDLRERFQWVSPIVVDPHDPETVYHASQRLHRSRDGGMNWEIVSPDLTTNTPEHQEASGGPINNDITGVEIFNTIFSVAISLQDRNTIWAGTDDGRVHITRDGGENWTEITPSDMPQWGTVDEIDVSAHQDGRAVMAVQNYRMDDFAPYIWVTDDFGQNWRRVTDGSNGIPADHPVRTVREDPEVRGLLYAGTEFGIFVSFDDGAHWQSLRLNLPETPVTGMRVAHGDIQIATQGRSFYILDDIGPLRDLARDRAADAARLYPVRDEYRITRVSGGVGEEFAPESHPGGAIVNFFTPEGSTGAEGEAAVTLEILDSAGQFVGGATTDSVRAADTHGLGRMPARAGMHRWVWNLQYPGPELADGAVIWGYTGGVKAPPGQYVARLTAGGTTQEQSFALRADPRLPDIATAEYMEQFRVAMAIRDSVTVVHRALSKLQSARLQAEAAVDRADQAGVSDQVEPAADALKASIADVEIELNQVNSESGQDPIRYAGKVDNQYLELYGNVTGQDGYISGGPEGAPTPSALERFEDLNGDWQAIYERVRVVLDVEVAEFNELIERLGLPAIVLEERGPIT